MISTLLQILFFGTGICVLVYGLMHDGKSKRYIDDMAGAWIGCGLIVIGHGIRFMGV